MDKLKKGVEAAKGPTEAAGSKIDNALGRQIRGFRAIFGVITTGIATDFAIKVGSGETIDVTKMVGTGIVWVFLCTWFALTYRIEHWDEREKSKTDNNNLALKNNIDTLSEIRYYALNKWLPDAKTDGEKITILNALGKLMSFANVDDLKGDFAMLHTSLADAFNMMLNEFKNVKSSIQSEIFSSMDKIRERDRKNLDGETENKDLFPKDVVRAALNQG